MPRTNRSDYGDAIDYDPDFRGPLKHRSCTDVLCLGLFAVFIACWMAIGVYALTKGDQENILVPQDSHGRRCGRDSSVLDKPYLHFVDITKCIGPQVLVTGCLTRQVCVERCPDKEFYFSSRDDLHGLVCDLPTPPATVAEAHRHIADGACSKWYVRSVPVFKRCIFLTYPLKYFENNETKAEHLKERLSVTVSWLALSVQNTASWFTGDARKQQSVTLVAEDIVQSWWQILIGMVLAVVVCLIYIFLMKIMAGIMTWVSIFGVMAVFAFCVYETVVMYLRSKAAANPSDQYTTVWLWLAIISSALLVLMVLLVLFLRKRIVIAIALIRQGSKAVSATMSTLFFPIVPWIMQVGVLAFAMCVGLYLTTLGEPVYKTRGLSSSDCGCPPNYKDGEPCEPSDFKMLCTKYEKEECRNASCYLEGLINPAYVNVFQVVNVVGALWAVFFVTAFGEMTLAATFATWYWTFNKSDVPFFTLTVGLTRTIRYHLGTLAFGSLIITICRLIRIAIEYVDHKTKKFDNEIVKALLCCCKCFFWCLEKFLKFINRNAYIMCAIHGKNFCTSARDAFGLLMRNVVRVFVLDKVTDMLFFMGKLLITAVTACIAYFAFSGTPLARNLHYTAVPVVCVAICAFLISCIFFGVYAMAVDTLFLCFLEDCERNDGSPAKPYYMSKELMRILGKKNKKL